MIGLALDFATAAVGMSLLLCVWRLARGPEVIDRVLALDTMYVNVVALVVLLGIRLNTALFFEAALLIALLGFVSTVALARYVSRGDVIE
jgi:multicomponent K+:H+ antiporter subunit F